MSLVHDTHCILKSLGHKIPLGHVYELFSRLQGYQTHNHNIERKMELPPSEGQFRVKITAESDQIEIKHYILVNASTQAEAESIAETMVKNEDFIEKMQDNLSQWEVIWHKADMTVQRTTKKEIS